LAVYTFSNARKSSPRISKKIQRHNPIIRITPFFVADWVVMTNNRKPEINLKTKKKACRPYKEIRVTHEGFLNRNRQHLTPSPSPRQDRDNNGNKKSIIRATPRKTPDQTLKPCHNSAKPNEQNATLALS